MQSELKKALASADVNSAPFCSFLGRMLLSSEKPLGFLNLKASRMAISIMLTMKFMWEWYFSVELIFILFFY